MQKIVEELEKRGITSKVGLNGRGSSLNWLRKDYAQITATNDY